MFNMEYFPSVVLFSIFEKLDINSRLQASLVCKRWLDHISSSVLLQDIIVKVNTSKQTEFLTIFDSMSRAFIAFEFVFIDLEERFEKFLKKFENQFVFLSFTNCSRQKSESFIKLKCENLKILSLSKCQGYCWEMFAYLPNIETLSLSDPQHELRDKDLSQIDEIITMNVKNLVFRWMMICDTKVSKRFYCMGLTYETHPSTEILSLSAIEKFIHKRRFSLQSLYFHFPFVKSDSIKEVLEMDGLKLSQLVNPSHFTSSKCYICQPTLTSLSVGGAVITDEDVALINEKLPSLRELCISHGNNLQSSPEILFRTERLTKLGIISCGCTKESYEKAVQRNYFKSIRLIHLSLHGANITATSIGMLLEQISGGLRSLDLSSCEYSYDDLIASGITFPRLTRLSMAEFRCQGIEKNPLKLRQMQRIVPKVDLFNPNGNSNPFTDFLQYQSISLSPDPCST